MIRILVLTAMACIAVLSQVHAAAAPNVRFTTTEGTWMTVDVSPDGRHVLFDLIGHLYEMPIEGGEARPLTQGWEWNRAASYSPDGRQIALVRDATGPDEVWIMNRDGSGLRRVTDHSAEASGSLRGTPSWTPDGRGIVFGTDASDGLDVGAITQISARFTNVAQQFVEAVDLSLDYRRPLGDLGTMSLSVAATRNLHNVTKFSAISPEVENLRLKSVLPWQGNLQLWHCEGKWKIQVDSLPTRRLPFSANSSTTENELAWVRLWA